jgi:hypothetical protein
MRLGCDPEVFLLNEDGNPVSSIGKVGGTKEEPIQVPNLPKGFTLQEDNVSVEFGVPPARNRAMWVKNINMIKNAALAQLPNHSFSNLSCIVFPKEQLRHPKALIFGCEPDFNAWTGEMNPSPCPPNPAMRSAGGHIHVETKIDAREGVKAMDFFLGLPSLLMDIYGKDRRQIYGREGSFRPKPYGFEYRVLSNFWIFQDKYARWVWDQTARALDFVNSGYEVPTSVPHIISTNDLYLAKAMVKEYDLKCC